MGSVPSRKRNDFGRPSRTFGNEVFLVMVASEEAVKLNCSFEIRMRTTNLIPIKVAISWLAQPRGK